MNKCVILGALLLTLVLAGCSGMQQVPMNQAQTDSYNQCMGTHWSSLADTALFGVAGYEYHQNMVLNCRQVALAKGTQNAADGTLGSDQPSNRAQATVASKAPRASN